MRGSTGAGRSATRRRYYADVLQEIGAPRLDDLRELRRRLEEIRMAPRSLPATAEAAVSV